MLTINNQLKLTEPTNKIICNYANKVVLKDFLLKFSFSNNTNNFNKIKKRRFKLQLQHQATNL